MIRAITYARCSTDMQEHSVDDQQRSLAEWAAAHGYAIINKYVDDGISGASVSKRPGFLQMIEDITQGRLSDIKALLIWDSYRFSRNMVESLTYKDMVRRHGISVIAITEPMVDDDAQLYIDAINGASGELYLRKLSRDSKRGIRAKVVDRHQHWGFAPYGYLLDKNIGKLVINEAEARWVRYIFDSVESGKGYLEICRELNTAGITTKRGAKWQTTTLTQLLRNRTYEGKLEVNLDGEHGIYDGDHPAIVDPDLYERVRKIVDERKARHLAYVHQTNRKAHWLSGLLRCKKCGAALSYRKNNGRAPRYLCNSSATGIRCANPSISVSVLEEMVYAELRRRYDGVSVDLDHVRIVRPTVIVDYDAEIKKLNNQLSRAKKAYIEEIDTIEEYRENKARINAAIEEAEKKRAEVLPFDAPRFREKCFEALTFLQGDAPMEEKVDLAHSLIEKIVVDGYAREVEIFFYD